MKEFKGTPGPWVVDANGVQARWNIDDVNGNSVAITHQLPNDKDWQKRDANTHLIAAAPELLEALRDLVALVKSRSYPSCRSRSDWGRAEAAEAIIAKANGRYKMKLIDLLVQELRKRGGWPKVAVCATQDGDGEVYFSDGAIPKFGGVTAWHEGDWCGNEFYTVTSTDYDTAIITREQYEAALAASKTVEVIYDATSAGEIPGGRLED